MGSKIIAFGATKSSRQIYQFHKMIFIKKISSVTLCNFLAQNLDTLVLTTCPKLSSRSVVDFTESQI
jgi:hypothetical protein